jgi:mobilome CxxCx(11)CxxC protein
VTQVDQVEQLRNDCRQKANYAFGTASIFEHRMRRLERLRYTITYLGIIVPVLVGSLALTSLGKTLLPYMEFPAGVVITLQLALSIWSIIAKWDEKYLYALGAMQVQTKLFNSWNRLAKYPPPDLERRVHELLEKDELQENSDLAQNVSDKEKRYGLRKTLYHYGLTCATCQIKPSSMKPSKCDTCGNF